MAQEDSSRDCVRQETSELPEADHARLTPRLQPGEAHSLEEAHLVGYWKGFDDAKKGLAGLSDENERDARRYRWLRDPLHAEGPDLVCSCGPEELDAAIDAAMSSPTQDSQQ